MADAPIDWIPNGPRLRKYVVTSASDQKSRWRPAYEPVNYDGMEQWTVAETHELALIAAGDNGSVCK